MRIKGNGRVARMLASLMANQAALPPLNFAPIDQIQNSQGYKHYIRAIHEGLNCNYGEMEAIFEKIIKVS